MSDGLRHLRSAVVYSRPVVGALRRKFRFHDRMFGLENPGGRCGIKSMELHMKSRGFVLAAESGRRVSGGRVATRNSTQDVFGALGLASPEDRAKFRELAKLGRAFEAPETSRYEYDDTRNNTTREGGDAQLEPTPQ